MKMVCICAMLTLELRQFQVSSTATAVILTMYKTLSGHEIKCFF